ncbi:MAG TPA: hypothetical protein DFS52_25615 [Myxococcales bacterium]|jgi:hypothetical protein|nr:hypothetical protein [Myxococcales bacterium]
MSLHSHARLSLLAAGLAVALSVPAQVGAAELTRVASSFDLDNPFDLDLELGYARTQKRAKITRERHQDGRIANVIEMRYHQVTQEMPMRLAIGIYQDLELHVGASLVFSDQKLWRFPGLDEDGKVITNENNSTVVNNCVNPDGSLVDPGCKGDSFAGAQPIFPIPGQSYRGGFSNITVGTKWAPLSDRRDDTKPKWVLGFDYTIPSSSLNNPSKPTSASDPGNIGDMAHRLTVSTALSKRLGAIDPYVKLHYTFPTRATGYYSNCRNPENLGSGGNCGSGAWTFADAGYKPQQVAGLLFGAEFFPYDDPMRKQSVSIDLQAAGSYVSSGRVYNELSDAAGKLLWTEEYMTIGGSIGVNARPVEYVQFRLSASLYHETEHFLSGEQIGKDINNACGDDTSRACVDLGTNEVNPTFDFRYDMPGRRFRISETSVFSVMATGVLNF